MDNDKRIKIWMNYMITQKTLIHFSKYCEVLPQNIQHWGMLQFPILSVNYGTENYPPIKIIPFEDFNNDLIEYWEEVMENKSGLIKWNSNCNRIPLKLINK